MNPGVQSGINTTRDLYIWLRGINTNKWFINKCFPLKVTKRIRKQYDLRDEAHIFTKAYIK